MVHSDGSADHVLLFAEALVRNAAAAACDILHIRIEQHRQHGRRGCGIADAHFTNPQHVRVGALGQLHTGADGSHGLFPRHGWAVGDILRPVGDLSVQNGFLRNVGIHAHIADRDPTAKVPRQHGGTGLAPGQVHRLLQGHGLGRAGHALLHHAVIGGKDQKMLLFDGALQFSRDARKLNGQFLQPSQTARRFGKLCLPCAGSGHCRLIQWLDLQVQ